MPFGSTQLEILRDQVSDLARVTESLVSRLSDLALITESLIPSASVMMPQWSKDYFKSLTALYAEVKKIKKIVKSLEL